MGRAKGLKQPSPSGRSDIAPFIVMDVLKAANERQARGENVLHLEVGQPSTPAPRAVIEAARAALDNDKIGYTEALGLPSLRARIARHYGEAYGVDLDPRRVVVTTGSSGAFILSFLVAFSAGDRVALARPGYPAYRNILAALDVIPVPLDVGLETRFQPHPDLLGTGGGDIAGLLVASPANPTGTMLDRDGLQELSDWCRNRGAWLISDEIYHGITYNTAAQTMLALDDGAIVINSFSKYFSMTGWRLGWMVMPEQLIRPLECLAQNLFISPPALSQLAAMAAFDAADELDGHVRRYASNRDLLLEGLPKAGFSRLAPSDGAFYLYADVSELTDNSEDFCRRMLAETGVAIAPGTDFDDSRGQTTVRFSFAGSTDDMAEAVRRIQ